MHKILQPHDQFHEQVACADSSGATSASDELVGSGLEDLEKEWDKSLQKWLAFLEDKNEDELFQDIVFIGFDGHNFAAKLKDIALQLNYHSIHHRGQIQFVIRKQGFEPDFVDYIGTVYRKID